MSFESRELYRDELEHRDKLRATLSIPFGLLVILGGLLGRMLQDAWINPSLLAWIFSTAAGAGGFFFARAAYYLIRSYHGHRYKALPTAMERRVFLHQLCKWYADQGDDASTARAEYDRWLDAQYAVAADKNWYVNSAKAEFLYRANGALMFCGILAAVAYVPFVIHSRTAEPELQRVSIVSVASPIMQEPRRHD